MTLGCTMWRPRMRLLLASSVCLVVLGASTPSVSHPHDDPEIFEANGTLTKIDIARQFIEMDVIDNRTKAPRNQLFFVDRKVKIRAGRTRLQLTDLRPGQRVRCTVERQHSDGREDLARLIVFEIRLDARS
jgi:hypothetical protein